MTTEAVAASAKLSERLFNELHFSDPALFDAKYLAGGPGVSSKM